MTIYEIVSDNTTGQLAAEVRRLRSQVGQHTKCAVCLQDKPTPLRRDEMGGYVCLTCVEKEMDRLREDNVDIDAKLHLEANLYHTACIELTDKDKEIKLLRERERVLVEAMVKVAKTEQEHCYAEPHRSEVNEIVQTRHDLRKCGDLARATLEAVKE